MLQRSLTWRSTKPNKFQSIAEYLSFTGDHGTKIMRLKESPRLLSKIDYSNRLQFWLSLIPPEQSKRSSQQFRELCRTPNLKSLLLDVPQRESIELDVSTAFNAINDFNSQFKKNHQALTETKGDQVKRVLSMFCLKNVHLRYSSGWASIGCVLSTLAKTEEDLFILFLFVITTVFPKDYFIYDPENDFRIIELYRFIVILKLKMPEFVEIFQLKQNIELDPRINTTLDEEDGLVMFVKSFLGNMFPTLYSTDFEISNIYKLWDIIFLEKNEMFLNVGLAVCMCFESKIKAITAQIATELDKQTMPHSLEYTCIAATRVRNLIPALELNALTTGRPL